MEFLTQTTAGQLISTFVISMAPVVELRGGLPYGIAFGLPYWQALIAAVLGNMLPVPFVIIYIRRVFDWLKKKDERIGSLVARLEERANKKSEKVKRYSLIGLCLLVAIPLPATGAWTGALVAALLDIRLKRAVPTIFVGVCIAAAIMTAIVYGVQSAIG